MPLRVNPEVLRKLHAGPQWERERWDLRTVVEGVIRWARHEFGLILFVLTTGGVATIAAVDLSGGFPRQERPIILWEGVLEPSPPISPPSPSGPAPAQTAPLPPEREAQKMPGG